MNDENQSPCITACCGQLMRYVRRHMRRDGDSEKEVQRKAAWVVAIGSFAVNSLAPVVTYPSMAANFVVVVCLFVWAWARREVSEAYLRLATIYCCIAIFYMDALGASVHVRLWPLFVLLIDMLLVIEAPRYLTKWVVGAAVVWLLVVEIEFATRAIGLLDLPDSYSYDHRRERCDCAEPPCAHDRPLSTVNSLAGIYVVFLLDFFLTRGFADAVLAEKTKMAAAVRAAEDISRSLAGFDLETAGACLAQAEDELPDDLHASLRRLLENLGSYKPYLPQSMVVGPGDEGSESDCDSEVPSELPSSPKSPSRSRSGSASVLSVSTSTLSAGSTSASSKTLSPTFASPGSFNNSFNLQKSLRAIDRLARRAVAVVQLTLAAPDLTSDLHELAFREMHTSFLAAALAAASAHRGIVDDFTGLSVQATFNASRQAASPAAKALGMLRTLWNAEELAPCSGVAVMGPAMVGVLGTEALRRPVLLGEAPDLAVKLAGYAQAAGLECFICNTRMHLELCQQQAMRVVMDRVFFDDGTHGDAGRQVVVYELLLGVKGREDTPHENGPEEWMYELAACGAKEWEAYNAAGRRQLLGDGRTGDPDVWLRALAAGRAGRRWDFAPQVRATEEEATKDEVA